MGYVAGLDRRIDFIESVCAFVNEDSTVCATWPAESARL